MYGLLEPRRSIRKKSVSCSTGYFYGDIEEEDDDEEEFNNCQESNQEEEFLATVLVMIKKEVNGDGGDMSNTFGRWIDPKKGKWSDVIEKSPLLTQMLSDEENSYVDGEPGSSSLEDENLNQSDVPSSSDELFQEIQYRKRSPKIRSRNNVHSLKPKKSKNLKPEDAPYTAANPKTRGCKRSLMDSENVEYASQPKRKYSKQRRIIKGIEMFWNPPTESYGLAKPKSSEQYERVIRWSLEQLPKHVGTTEEVFTILKQYGWPELKKGNTREALICKNTIGKILLDQLEEKTVNESHCSSSLDQSSEGAEIEDEEVDERLVACSKHIQEDTCSRDCPFRSTNVVSHKTRDELEEDFRNLRADTKARDNRKAKREMYRTPSLLSDETPEEAWWETTDDFQEIQNVVQKKLTGAPKKASGSSTTTNNTTKENGKGRRWVRFACEKHRREHARCPDNCPLRKKSYVDDEANDDEMEIESQSKERSVEDVIVDESTEAL